MTELKIIWQLVIVIAGDGIAAKEGAFSVPASVK